jgi:hypothetical protein
MCINSRGRFCSLAASRFVGKNSNTQIYLRIFGSNTSRWHQVGEKKCFPPQRSSGRKKFVSLPDDRAGPRPPYQESSKKKSSCQHRPSIRRRPLKPAPPLHSPLLLLPVPPLLSASLLKPALPLHSVPPLRSVSPLLPTPPLKPVPPLLPALPLHSSLPPQAGTTPPAGITPPTCQCRPSYRHCPSTRCCPLKPAPPL